MGGDFGRHPVRPVVPDDPDDVAATDAELDQAEREIPHPALIVVPGEWAPEPEILFAQRDFAAMFLGVEAQQLRIGIGLGEPNGVTQTTAVSAGPRVSTRSTRGSSASPREATMAGRAAGTAA